MGQAVGNFEAAKQHIVSFMARAGLGPNASVLDHAGLITESASANLQVLAFGMQYTMAATCKGPSAMSTASMKRGLFTKRMARLRRRVSRSCQGTGAEVWKMLATPLHLPIAVRLTRLPANLHACLLTSERANLIIKRILARRLLLINPHFSQGACAEGADPLPEAGAAAAAAGHCKCQREEPREREEPWSWSGQSGLLPVRAYRKRRNSRHVTSSLFVPP
jgi:hypothetical protein